MKKILIIIIFFSIDHKSVVKSVDFLKEIGTLYDLLIYLFDNPMRMVSSTETQIHFLKATTVFKTMIKFFLLKFFLCIYLYFSHSSV